MTIQAVALGKIEKHELLVFELDENNYLQVRKFRNKNKLIKLQTERNTKSKTTKGKK